MRQIFVFGSNTKGIHGAGAALCALTEHGAIQGVSMGLQGNSYAIITKHLPDGERSVTLRFISSQIAILFFFSTKRPDLIFNVTRIGCGHAGFKEEEIAPLFKDYTLFPNIVLCKEFKEWLNTNML
jgi:hypothetical protein